MTKEEIELKKLKREHEQRERKYVAAEKVLDKLRRKYKFTPTELMSITDKVLNNL